MMHTSFLHWMGAIPLFTISVGARGNVNGIRSDTPKGSMTHGCEVPVYGEARMHAVPSMERLTHWWRRRPGIGQVLLATAVVVLGVALLIGWGLWSSRSAHLQERRVALQAMARTTALQLGASLQQADRGLSDLLLRLQAASPEQMPQEALRLELRWHQMAIPTLRSLSLHDTRGNTLVSVDRYDATRQSSAPVLDPQDLVFHRSAYTTSLRLGTPYLHDASSEWRLPVTRAYRQPDGAVSGVLRTEIGLQPFMRRDGDADPAQGIRYAIWDQHGQLLTWTPDDLRQGVQVDKTQRRPFQGSSGIWDHLDPQDGRLRQGAYAAVPEYGLWTVVTVPSAGLLSEWRRESMISAGLFLALTMGLVMLVRRLLRVMQRQHTVETELRQAQNELLQANHALTVLAREDALTGLLNRREFDRLLDMECRRAQRGGSTPGLLMIDVDWFKPYNDCYGHLAGDTCLREVAASITDCVRRPGDVVARYGGEEFVVILPESDESGLRAVAEHIRAAVQQRMLPHRGSPLGVVSVSIGLAVWQAGVHDTPTSLVLAADRALYAAKRAGRNLVMSSRWRVQQDERDHGADEPLLSHD